MGYIQESIPKYDTVICSIWL